jgi:signal transduction histidine kinase/DNA-binding LacI/PurR family transcriptional regulator/AraC-like DNA-binding protein
MKAEASIRHGGHRRRCRAANGFPTIGLLLADLHTGASCSLWPGVAEEAERRGVNLVCFAGGRLRMEEGFEAGRNDVYDLAGPDCLDGLLTWASSLGGALEPSEVDAFHCRYRKLPMVCLSQTVAGAPTVALDAYRGMREVIGHLVEAHGFRKIGFIRGPSAHTSACDRFRAYTDSLAEHGIPRAEERITPPLRWDCGEEGARILLDERGLRPGADVQAIAAASDLLAFRALKGIQSRGYSVPADLAVTGFNDTAESRLASPPLTTAVMPLRDQGAQALDILMSIMAGEPVAPFLTLPSQLVVRQSCGCSSAAVTLAVSDLDPPAGGGCSPAELSPALQETRAACVAEMARLAGLAEDTAAAWLEPLLDAFLGDAAGAAPRRFLSTLDSALDRAIRAEVEIPPWQNAVSALRRRALALLRPAERPAVEDLFAQARVLISEAAGKERTYRQWSADRLAENLREIGTSLLMTFNVERLADALSESLPRLGVESAYLALYEEADEDRQEARLVLARTERGRVALPTGGIAFPSRLLVPREYLPRTRRYDLVVEPLHFQERRIGFAVFEIGPRDGAVYESLRGYLASALKGALLFSEARGARLAAEKADLIKTRLLANVSHELRAPLDIIIRRAGAARDSLAGSGSPAVHSPHSLEEDLAVIRGSAEHQLRVIDDLLDLSRAEIDELDLDLELLDPRPIIGEAFDGFAQDANATQPVEWRLEAPDRLPLVRVDPVRLRQILINLLANARAATKSGSVILTAEVAPPGLRINVADTGPGIPAEMKEWIFEPFASAERGDRRGRGIGLGLSIASRLTSLHGGTLTVESEVGKGSVFHLWLPLPDLSGKVLRQQGEGEPVLLLISHQGEPPEEIGGFCRRRGLAIRQLRAETDWEAQLGDIRPAALAWDLCEAGPGDWPLIRRLRRHPGLLQAPMVLYAGKSNPAAGLTGVLPKSAAQGSLLELIDALAPRASAGPLLIVEDDPEQRGSYEALVREGLPGVRALQAEDGEEALKAMQEEAPCLVLLDLMMPRMDGFALLDAMRADPRLQHVPVVILTHKSLDDADIRRLEAHARVTLQSKGIWSDAETVAALNRSLFGTECLPPHTGALVKRAAAWLARNHASAVSRWKLAEAVSASEDYLSRIFHRELGLSPWEYLNRYRIRRAEELLRVTSESVKAIARTVGFRDQAYFSRVFRKVTGRSPQEFRHAQ